jgi:hypothetical protein
MHLGKITSGAGKNCHFGTISEMEFHLNWQDDSYLQDSNEFI